jgi:hypothetical protein
MINRNWPRTSLRLVVILVFVAPGVSCGQKAGIWKGTMVKRDGLTIVKNPDDPIWPPNVLDLREELSLGEKEGGREESLFSLIRGIDADKNGNIYVLDRNPPFIRVFDKSGAFMLKIGQKGQGPGEMESPNSFQITPSQEVMVFDWPTRRLTFFSPEGQCLRQISTASVPPFISVKKDASGNLVGIPLLPPPAGQELRKLAPDLKPLLSVARIESEGSGEEFYVLSPYLMFDVATNGNIIWARSDQYVLHILSPEGRIIREIHKDYKPQEVTETYKRSVADRFRRVDASGQSFKLKFAKHFPPIYNLSADEQGRVFVETYEKVRANPDWTYFDVFDAQGRYLTKVPIKHRGGQELIWKKGCLYKVEQDDEGYSVVKKFKVAWNFGGKN